MSVHYSTRCLVNVREAFSESIKIVSFATKKVNEWPVVVSLEASVIVGFPPERTNFPSLAVYWACSAVPRRSPCCTTTPPVAKARSSWRGPAAAAGGLPEAAWRASASGGDAGGGGRKKGQKGGLREPRRGG